MTSPTHIPGKDNVPSKKPIGYLHQVMQRSGAVNIAWDRKTAKGRLHGFRAIAFSVEGDNINLAWMNGV